MKLLAVSDIHGQFSRFAPASLPEAEVALVCGDLTNLGLHIPAEVAAAERWMNEMATRYGQVLYVLGNHDLLLPNSYFERERAAIKNITGQVVVFGGFRFAGADLSPCFNLPDLARSWERMTADRAVDAACFDALPAADVVVSHCLPFGVLDEGGRPGSGEHLGSPGLRQYIERITPRLLVCGHIHEGSGEAMLGSTRVVNVARRHALLELAE